jgi:hypothetical protein
LEQDLSVCALHQREVLLDTVELRAVRGVEQSLTASCFDAVLYLAAMVHAHIVHGQSVAAAEIAFNHEIQELEEVLSNDRTRAENELLQFIPCANGDHRIYSFELETHFGKYMIQALGITICHLPRRL